MIQFIELRQGNFIPISRITKIEFTSYGSIHIHYKNELDKDEIDQLHCYEGIENGSLANRLRKQINTLLGINQEESKNGTTTTL